MSRVVTHAGVVVRHIARPDQTALDLAVIACSRLFERNPELKGVVDGIVLCTQTPDYIMPPNACVLHRALALNESVFCCDTNLACSGFVYSLTLAEGLISSGTCANVLLVTADTYSKLIHSGDRSTRTLFGNGAAVYWIAASNDTRGVVDILCETSGAGFERFYVPAGGWRNPRTPATKQLPHGNLTSDEHINMDGMGVLAFVKSKIPAHVGRILDRNHFTAADIDLFVFHQASRTRFVAVLVGLDGQAERNFAQLCRCLAQIPDATSCDGRYRIPIARSFRWNQYAFHIIANLGTVVTVRRRTVDVICDAIQRHRVELLPTTPSFLNILVHSDVSSRYDLSSLKAITYGTEAMPQTTLDRLQKLFPTVKLQQTYGLSEFTITT